MENKFTEKEIEEFIKIAEEKKHKVGIDNLWKISYNNLGLVLIELGKTIEAENHFQLVLASDYENEKAKEGLRSLIGLPKK